uniref:MKRN2 opposite strand protein-like C-terminal domain-containing protein n=1 Tax=Sus scrofa TaxID=9823 RepID=A0A8D1Q5S6_PIG
MHQSLSAGTCCLSKERGGTLCKWRTSTKILGDDSPASAPWGYLRCWVLGQGRQSYLEERLDCVLTATGKCGLGVWGGEATRWLLSGLPGAFSLMLCLPLALAAGVVYNYTVHGVQRDKAGWEQSVSIPLLQPGMFGLMDQWDKYLEDFSTAGAWLPHRYEEDHHNCYSYTLMFINCVLTTEGKERLDKNEFTEKFVVPRTRKASKYITLYRAIEERGFYVTDAPDPGRSPPSGSGLC